MIGRMEGFEKPLVLRLKEYRFPKYGLGLLIMFLLFLPGCETERLKGEIEWLKKENSTLRDERAGFQSEINRLTAERDEQRKLRRDLEIENRKLKKRLTR